MHKVWIGLLVAFLAVWLLRCELHHEVLNPEPSISLTGLLWGIGALAAMLALGTWLQHLNDNSDEP